MSQDARIDIDQLKMDVCYMIEHHVSNYGELWSYELPLVMEEAIDFAMAWYCLDCRQNTNTMNEYYMVYDEVWLQAVPDGDGMMCIGCLENRLKRKLAPEDFTNCGLNQMKVITGSDRLRSRIAGKDVPTLEVSGG